MYGLIRGRIQYCQGNCSKCMCQNGQGELPRAMGSTRMRARTESSGRRGPAQPHLGQARQKAVRGQDHRSGFADLEENRAMVLLIPALGAIRGWSLPNRVSPPGVMPIGGRPQPSQCVTLV